MNVLDASRRAHVVDLLREGRPVRYITLHTGVASATITSIRRREGVLAPPCGCGRPAGHRGMCRGRRGDESRDHAPRLVSTHARRPASTALGKLIDREIARLGWSTADLARRSRVSVLVISRARHGAKFAVVVWPAIVDALAEAVGASPALLGRMHLAAVRDMGYRIPDPAEPRAATPETPRRVTRPPPPSRGRVVEISSGVGHGSSLINQ